jgi:hypothetical protein
MPFIGRLSVAKSKHTRGLLRAGGYLVVLSLGLGAFQLRAAHAEVRNRTVELGRQMYSLANATQQDVNKLSINGQPIWIGSSIAKDSVSDVLDRYEGECQKNLAQPSENWRELAQKIDEKKEKKPALAGSGVMRGGGDAEGTVLCFTKGENSKPTVREAFKSFVDTGELGALGNLRYVYAKQSERGRTVVLTAWTDDKFNLSDIVPKDGAEAKGSDFAGIPRPPSANRLLSAQVEGTPFGANVYRSKQDPATIVGFYDDEMTKRGWAGFDPELKMQHALAGKEDKTGVIGRLYEHNGVVLSLASHVDEGETITSLGLAGVTSTDGTKTDTGVKAADDPKAAKVTGAVTKNASTASDP